VPFLEQIQREHPADFWSHFTLGVVLTRTAPDRAISCFHAAVALRPDSAVACTNLGAALGATGRIDEALFQFQRAIRLDPEHVLAHANLGRCFFAKGRHAEAVASILATKRLDADAATTLLRCNLGGSLLELGRVDDAIVELREAVAREPGSSMARYGLGFALHVAGQLADAEAELRRAAAIDPRYAATHESLARVLEATGRRDDAIESYREAARLDARRSAPRRALIDALLARGRREEARAEARQLLESCAADDPSRVALQALVEHCERVVALHEGLPALPEGEHGAAGHLALATLFSGQGDAATAARHFLEAERLGKGTPSWGRDFRPFDAARCAAKAGALGGLAGALALDAGRRALREQALAWLRDELAGLEALLAASARGARQNVLIHVADLRADPALAGVRDATSLALLSDEEQAEWHALWRDVEALARRAVGDE
jgi:tetratricopeptide (TPR) repeat protein